MSALFMTRNSSTVSMDSGENSNSFASAIGVLERENCDIFRSEIEEKIFTKAKKTKTKTKNIIYKKKIINCISFRSARCK